MKNKREKKTQIESKAPFFFNYNEIKKKILFLIPLYYSLICNQRKKEKVYYS
jgi:hypothetical protein